MKLPFFSCATNRCQSAFDGACIPQGFRTNWKEYIPCAGSEGRHWGQLPWLSLCDFASNQIKSFKVDSFCWFCFCDYGRSSFHWRLLYLSGLPCKSDTETSFFFFFLIYFVEVELIFNVVLISAVQQSESVIHIYIFFFFVFFSIMEKIIGYYLLSYLLSYYLLSYYNRILYYYIRILNIVPYAIQKDLVVYPSYI